jgi:hypothetical protein
MSSDAPSKYTLAQQSPTDENGNVWLADQGEGWVSSPRTTVPDLLFLPGLCDADDGRVLSVYERNLGPNDCTIWWAVISAYVYMYNMLNPVDQAQYIWCIFELLNTSLVLEYKAAPLWQLQAKTWRLWKVVSSLHVVQLFLTYIPLFSCHILFHNPGQQGVWQQCQTHCSWPSRYPPVETRAYSRRPHYRSCPRGLKVGFRALLHSPSADSNHVIQCRYGNSPTSIVLSIG